MFKGLSPRAQRLYSVLSPREAKRFGSSQIFPEHMMIALIICADGTGYDLLKKLKINIPFLLQELEAGIPSEPATVFFGDIPDSPRLRAVLETAAAAAASFKHDYIGTEHLAFACICEEMSATNAFMNKENISAEEVRAIVQEISPGRSSRFDITGTESHRRTPDNPADRIQAADKFLLEFCRDITAECRADKLDPVIGRETEIRRMVQILSRRNKNNPMLVGDPGVGKTAIVEGLAAEIVAERVPHNLVDKRILALDLASVIAGTKFRGEFEERFKKIVREIESSDNIILFIDEIHTLVGAGSAEGSMDASNMLKPALARGKLHCIGATTQDEYRKYIEKDAALERRFQTISVLENSPEETLEILKGIKNRYCSFHHVNYTDEALDAAVSLSRRYISGRFFPDKAIDVLDEAGARKKIENDHRPEELHDIEERIVQLNEEKKELVKTQNYERAAFVRDEVRSLKARLEELNSKWRSPDNFFVGDVSAEDVASVVSEITGVPVSLPGTDESLRLVSLEKEIHRTVVGQNDAVKAVANAIRRSRAGLKTKKRPAGSFIFMGPTGVGKTLLAKALADFLFGSEESLIRVDMSEYMEKHNASKLVGAPPGYVGYNEGGVLTEKVRRRPYSVVLLDEIEKAHPDVFSLLLQILEEGELYDTSGRRADFSNTFIIMTGNIGARFVSGENRLGFSSSDSRIPSYKEMKAGVSEELKHFFNPEFLNRVDDVIVFTPLSNSEVSEILDMQLREVADSLAQQGIGFSISESARSVFIKQGYEPDLGARPMRRLIQREVEDPLALLILERKILPGDILRIDAKNGGICLKVKKHPAKPFEAGQDEGAGYPAAEEHLPKL